jgi:5-formyltetrahydrofolate cyclo-ligase
VDLAAKKIALRTEAMGLRAGCDPALGTLLAEHVMRDCAPPPGAVVAGFWPMAHEIDILPLLNALAGAGHEICLPETPKMGLPLIFRKWQPGEALVEGRFGTMHPLGKVSQPDFVLVPLLAFDARGNRLGYGGGYYDRTLAGLPDAFRLGCAFAAQEFSEVPVEATDLRLHAVATELGVRRF